MEKQVFYETTMYGEQRYVNHAYEKKRNQAALREQSSLSDICFTNITRSISKVFRERAPKAFQNSSDAA